jgi:hypothetical protein
MIPVLVKSVWLRNICFSKLATTLFKFIDPNFWCEMVYILYWQLLSLTFGRIPSSLAKGYDSLPPRWRGLFVSLGYLKYGRIGAIFEGRLLFVDWLSYEYMMTAILVVMIGREWGSSNNKILNARLLTRVITGCHYM